jgi:hypothetical protein
VGQNEDVGAAEGRIVTERIIAIGDVHGCSPALASLVRAIDPPALDTLVFLGDYIDGGYPIWYPIFSGTPLVWQNPLRLNCLADKGFAQGR